MSAVNPKDSKSTAALKASAETLATIQRTRQEISGARGEDKPGYAGLPARVIGKEYADINRWIDDGKYTYYDFKGGRGSLKSSFCALKLVDILMLNENKCAMAVRQVKDTLKDSVYSQIIWAIDELGLTEEFHATKSPMEIRRKKTGQIIYFRGADDPSKIKSIRPPKGMYIGVLWIEESDQITGQETLRNIYQSAMRGGENTIIFRSYNTPISQKHYINQEALKPNARQIIHHSYYYSAPPEWLGKSFLDLAAHVKQTNERAYRHEYLGEAIGQGGNVFENVEVREITQEEYDMFDRVYAGIDWGFYPDPFHFCVMHYDAARLTLYIFDEKRMWKASNRETANELRQYAEMVITADNSEPKSIKDYESYGFQVQAATKGPDSVKYSMKWLASLEKIIINPVKCPYTAEEFTAYEFERTKDGEWLGRYPDKNNHAIDAVRYGMCGAWKIRGE